MSLHIELLTSLEQRMEVFNLFGKPWSAYDPVSHITLCGIYQVGEYPRALQRKGWIIAWGLERNFKI